MIDHEAIFRAKQEIQAMIRERPEYAEFQSNLELKLKNAGNSHNRMVLLQQMMFEKVNELGQLWTELRPLVLKVEKNK